LRRILGMLLLMWDKLIYIKILHNCKYICQKQSKDYVKKYKQIFE
ncbi:hypothetical protein UFOVP987_67, partial [uncultured Caudovirales phage]